MTAKVRLRVPKDMTIQQLLELVEELSEATHEDPSARVYFQNDQSYTLVPSYISTFSEGLRYHD